MIWDALYFAGLSVCPFQSTKRLNIATYRVRNFGGNLHEYMTLGKVHGCSKFQKFVSMSYDRTYKVTNKQRLLHVQFTKLFALTYINMISIFDA